MVGGHGEVLKEAITVRQVLSHQAGLPLVEGTFTLDEALSWDPVLRPLYPEDMGPGERHLALFLGQYWGGPTTYSDQRGHPRLRMRHAPFAVGRAERDAWYGHMAEAVAASGARSEVADRLLEYFAMAAPVLAEEQGEVALPRPHVLRVEGAQHRVPGDREVKAVDEVVEERLPSDGLVDGDLVALHRRAILPCSS